MITEDDFKWTDELVKEFLDKYQLSRSWITGFDPTEEQMINFKKFKLFKKDYKILKGYAEISKINGQVPYKIITAIKRLSDGEIFKVNDNCYQGRIKRFEESEEGMSAYFMNDNTECMVVLHALQKETIVLFVTHDGVNVYKGDSVILLSNTTWTMQKHDAPSGIIKSPVNSVNDKPSFLYFSNEKAAKEYINWNKPHLSVSEIMQLSEYYGGGLENERRIFRTERLKEVSEQKL
jgi:hypothetical protein